MPKIHPLKGIRVIAALAFLFAITAYLCDFLGIIPEKFHTMTQIQIVPALLSGMLGILLIWIVVTLLFGRLYCSAFCPLGIMQDIISRFSGKGKKKKKKSPKKKQNYRFQKPYNWLRYTLLAISAVLLVIGITTPLLLLDPYSNFGRIAVNIFRPLLMEGNNAVSALLIRSGNFSVPHVTIYTLTLLSFGAALTMLLLVGIMSYRQGRLFCNTLCPVGSTLGLLSKFSLFRISLDETKCTKCGKCAQACKSQCIDARGMQVDTSRCVDCFNCLDRCRVGAIAYKPYKYKKSRKRQLTSPLKDSGRRRFLLTSAGIGLTAPLVSSCTQKLEGSVDITKLTPITPPGSLGLQHFQEKCTACHLCITHCPQQILKPAGFGFGIQYALKPHLSFYEKGFCNYTCTVCSEICPNGAIRKITENEKKQIQIGIAKLDLNLCVVKNDHTSCGACSEHCPVQAVRMEPYVDGLTIPRVYEELCIGCGGCESICPVRPIKAINVLANAVHGTAKLPEEEEYEEVDLEELDFGF
ncbi:4Fe-4S binding protein [Bacteroidales bacterium OttesenSCG-928-J19]|nr:4Fe-4S binding protein [Bacteroidales bacterium OttesenSCG-928-J19]